MKRREGIISRVTSALAIFELPDEPLADCISIELIDGGWHATFKCVQRCDVMAGRLLDPYE